MRRPSPVQAERRTGWLRLPRPGLLLLALFCWAGSLQGQGNHVVIVTGLGGMPEYEENFESWGSRLQELFAADPANRVYRLDGRSRNRKAVLELFQEVQGKAAPADTIWLFLVGHGTYDGRDYKFNITGPDLTGKDLSGFLESLGDRRSYVILATSASGVLVPELSGKHRVVLSATRNERERQPPLFLSFFIEAASSPAADTDKNGRVSLLEAFSFSEKKVAAWYADKGRIQTEHPLLSDGGQVRLGDSSSESTLVRAGTGLLSASAYLYSPPAQAYRSLEAQQLAAQRTVLEREIEDLKYRKGEMPEAQYFEKLQELLVEVATLNERIAELESAP